MMNKEGFGRRINSGMLRLTLLPIWVQLWMRGGSWSMLGSFVPIVLQLHRFMVAVSRVSVIHHGRGGSAPDPRVWDQGSRIKQRRLDIRVNVDLAMLPSLPGFLTGPGFRFMVGAFLVRTLLPGLFVSVCCVRSLFSEVLEDLGHFGVSYLEVLILFEQWAGHCLLSEKVTRPHERAHRPITISCVPVSGGIVMRQGCRFISSLVRALGELPGGTGRFLPCQVGSRTSRLRHLEWEQCSHGLTSRPLETCHHQCLSTVCGVFGYPSGAAAEL